MLCSFWSLSEWISSLFFCLIAHISSSPFFFISAISLFHRCLRFVPSEDFNIVMLTVDLELVKKLNNTEEVC